MRSTRAPRSPRPTPARALQRRLREIGGSILALGLVLTTGSAFLAAPAGAATAIGLGTATSYAVLAGQGITNTGVTTIRGDVGTFPNPSMTGFGPGANQVVLVPPSKIATAVEAAQAKDDLTTAYDQAAAASPRIELSAVELGGRTLTPGVYHHSTLGLTGTLTLNAQGNPDAVFIFQSDFTLTTAEASRVVVINGTTCNVFWQVGSSATLGGASTFLGTILANQSISVGTGAVIEGRLLARTGAVTLLSNTITRPTCAGPTPTTPTTAAPTSSTSSTSSSTTSTSSTSTPASTTSTSTTSTSTTSTSTPASTSTTSTSTPASTSTTIAAPTTSSTALVAASTTVVAPAPTVAPPAATAGGLGSGAPVTTTGGAATAVQGGPAASRTTLSRTTGGATALTSRGALVTTTTRRSGGPATTVARRPLARTGGVNSALPLAGATTVVVGMLLVLAAGPPKGERDQAARRR